MTVELGVSAIFLRTLENLLKKSLKGILDPLPQGEELAQHRGLHIVSLKVGDENHLEAPRSGTSPSLG